MERLFFSHLMTVSQAALPEKVTQQTMIVKKKELPNGETAIPDNDKEFTIKVRFEDIFGVGDVDADYAEDYTSIKYKVYPGGNEYTMESADVKVGSDTKKCGTIKLKKDQTATISGIPVNTKYTVYEDEPKYAPEYNKYDNTVDEGRIGTSPLQAESVVANSDPEEYEDNGNNVTVTNFSHTLTVKEVTDFSGVNSGLLSYTKTAAENDVFKYTLSNQGTASSDVVDSGIKTPTYDQYNRVNNGKTTTLTKADPVPDTTYIYLDTSEFTDWETTAQSRVGVYLNNTTGSPSHKTVLMDEISPHFFRAAITGYTKVQFMRINKDNVDQFLPDGYNDWYDGWNRLRVDDVVQGATYKVTGWNSIAYKSGPANTYPTESHNYTPGDDTSVSVAVANTNYEWTDQFASSTGADADGITGITGTTTPATDSDPGSLYLMHGTKAYNNGTIQFTQDKESSAKFYNQFARGSTMTVEQGTTLTSPNGGSPDTLKANNQRGAGTLLENYYTTTKTLDGSSDAAPSANDTFTYNNGNANKSIHITETFTNAVNTGAISVTKTVNSPTGVTNGETSNSDLFEFTISLTNVFGVTNTNVSAADYANIDVTGNARNSNGDNTPITKLLSGGKFYLKNGDTAIIRGIPVGTNYTITETAHTNYSTIGNVSNAVIANGTLDGNNTYTPSSAPNTIVNTRLIGNLVLQKAEGTYWDENNIPADKQFKFTVTLTKPSSISFENFKAYFSDVS